MMATYASLPDTPGCKSADQNTILEKCFTNFTDKAGIDPGSVTTILQDKSGNIWIATELGSGQLGEDGGVWRYDGSSFTKFTTADGLVHNGVFSILEDKSGNIWFGTRNNGLSRYDGKTFTTFSE
jgi:ligand-binding sensor domain-containing protein